MKIIFVTSGTIRSNFTYRALELARALQRRGHTVSILVPSADKYNNFTPEKVSSIDGVRILQPFQFNTRRREINLVPYIILAAYRVLREKSDLIYIYKPTPISIVGLLGKLVHKTPIVLDMDDLGSEVMRIEESPWLERTLVAWCERLAARYADRIVAASSYLYDMYHAQFPDKPIHRMSNGVDPEWFAGVVDIRMEDGVVFLGALNRRNILEPLFNIFPDIIKEHPHVTLLVIGGGTFLSYFKERAQTLGISDHVEFTDWLKLEDARKRLHAGDVGYNYMPDEPTIRAASNMKVSQYMACGVVPLVSNVGDLPAAIDNGNAGYIAEPGNEEDLKKVLLRALVDTGRKEKSLRARAFARNTFDWDILAGSFELWICGRTEKTKGAQKKIYVVATEKPANVGGAQIRNYNLIRQLSKDPSNLVEVFYISSTLATSKNEHVVSEYPSSLRTKLVAIFVKRVQPFMYEFEQSGIGDIFRKACERSLPDVVHIEQITGYYCVRSHIPWLRERGVTVILDAHNVEAEALRSAAVSVSWWKRSASAYILPKLRRLETEASRRCDAVFACSEIDAQYFKKYNHRVFVVPNGVDCQEFRSVRTSKIPAVLFMGGVSYPPNADGLAFYIKDVHPKVKERIPDIELLAIGANASWLDSTGLADSSVKPLGFVEDVLPYLSKAYVGICPVRSGSGTRIKIMTYMAAGLPVVSTKKGAEGVAYTHNQNIIIADSSEDFAEAVTRLFEDKAFRDRIATEGHSFISKHYDWDVIGEELRHIYQYEF